MNEKIKVGNVVFAEEGVMVVRAYDNSGAPIETTPKQLTYDDMRPILLALCVRRMRHCAKELEKNFASAKRVTSEFVLWNDGHFSLSVYKALQFFVGQKGIQAEFTPLIAQQCIREIRRAGSIYSGDYKDTDFYEELKNAPCGVDSVFMALTESMLCAIDNEKWSEMHK